MPRLVVSSPVDSPRAQLFGDLFRSRRTQRDVVDSSVVLDPNASATAVLDLRQGPEARHAVRLHDASLRAFHILRQLAVGIDQSVPGVLLEASGSGAAAAEKEHSFER